MLNVLLSDDNVVLIGKRGGELWKGNARKLVSSLLGIRADAVLSVAVIALFVLHTKWSGKGYLFFSLRLSSPAGNFAISK